MSGSDLQMGLLLGEIGAEVRSTNRTLADLTHRIESIGDRIEVMAEHHSRSTPAAPQVSPLERWIKNILTFGLPLFTAWATGSIEKGLQVLQALR